MKKATTKKKLGRPPGKKKIGRPRTKKEPTTKAPSLNGYELFAVEKDASIPHRGRVLDKMPDYIRLKEMVEKMKIREAIVIKTRWRGWPSRINKTAQLGFGLIVFKIEDNPEYSRVYRTK